jgi:hypothetical protein
MEEFFYVCDGIERKTFTNSGRKMLLQVVGLDSLVYTKGK